MPLKTKPLPPLEYLIECFALSDTSPSGLVWKLRPEKHFTKRGSYASHVSRCSGKPAGSVNTKSKAGDQYYVTSINGDKYLVHRIVYSLFKNKLLVEGVEVDHKDGNGLNNSLTNLRKAFHGQNQHNTKVSSKSKTGIKNVFLRAYNQTYYGRVSINGKSYKTSYSKNIEIVISEVRALRETLHS